jgi:SAM-dependent methyltransferase
MGIINETAAFMCDARRGGVSFRKTLTIGRHVLYVNDKTLEVLAREGNLGGSAASAAKGEYSEDFFRLFLGAEEVDSLDNSSYEGASITHDMNVPVPLRWEENYDAIVDAGTLEHVFNFPVALANCMRMVKTGGRLFFFAPANNQMGHGFYQFSPELFFSALSGEQGFVMERIVAVEFKYMGAEYGSLRRQYEVEDPRAARSRVTLANSRPVGLLVRARKIRHKSIPFGEYPQQSDYVRLWSSTAEARTAAEGEELGAGSTFRRLKEALPRPVKGFLRRVIESTPQSPRTILSNNYDMHFVHSFRNKTFFRPLKRG